MNGIELIAAERARQLLVECWSEEHDDHHVDAELSLAAACYATPVWSRGHSVPPSLWPWSLAWWKPSPNDRIKELAKAGALIAAEIERLQRLSQPRIEGESSCTVCSGCLPNGEQCHACGRIAGEGPSALPAATETAIAKAIRDGGPATSTPLQRY